MPPAAPSGGDADKRHPSHLTGRTLSSGGVGLETSAEHELLSPSALRKLVLNYLVHHCYINTAVAFAQDGTSVGSGESGAGALDPASLLASVSAGGTGQPSLAAGGSSKGASGSARRGAGANGSSHPLAAPPLIREDSQMEIEGESSAALHGDEAAAKGAADDEDAHMSEAHGPVATSNGAAKGKAPLRSASTDVGETDLSQEEVLAVLLRREVREHIINGRIRAAVECCNTHFPGVLATKGAARAGGSSRGAQDAADAARGGKERRASSKKDTKDKDGPLRLLPANPTSLDPAHLSLNLQIQEFIESVRAASSVTTQQQQAQLQQQQQQAAGSSPTSEHPPQGGLTAAAAGISRAASPAPSSASSAGSAASGGGSGASAVYHAALSYIQGLHATCMELSNPYSRAMYMKEIESVSVLLAYPDLEKSPVRKYLDQRRRIALAEQINSAILYRSGQPSQPLIESAARQTAFVWSQLHADKIAIPLHASTAANTAGTSASVATNGNATVLGGAPVVTTASSSGAITAASLLHGNGLRTYDCTDELATENGTKGDKTPSVRLNAPWDLRSFLAER